MSDSTRSSGTLDSSSRTREERDNRFPPGIPYIVGNEAAERFSFYGLRQILYVYMVGLFSGFATGDAISTEAKVHATQITHAFNAGAYLFPMIGAILADRFWGKYRVIFWVSMIYVLGHGCLAVAGHHGSAGRLDAAIIGMYVGLLLVSLGAGGIKPCVSANVGDQFTERNGHLVTRIFQVFYFTINFGSFFASLLIPWLYQHYGAEIAFGVPGILMAVATLVFWLGRKKFVRVPPKPGGPLGFLDFVASTLMTVPLLLGIYIAVEESHTVVDAGMKSGIPALVPALAQAARAYWWEIIAAAGALAGGVVLAQFRQQREPDSGFLAVLLYCVRHRGTRKAGEDFWTPARTRFGEEAAEGPPAVLRIIVVFSMVSVFWALFDQHSSTWIEQATAMDRALVLPRWIWYGWFVPAGLLSTLFTVVALFLWIGNRPLSRGVRRLFFASVLLWLAIAVVLQIVRGGMVQIDLLPSQLAALNPFFVMMIIPLLNFGVYEPLERQGRPLAPLHRMTIGMFLAAASFAAVALLQMRIAATGAGQVHVLWQLVPYVILTTSEVLVSITGLEFAYTQAPRAMKSTIMGFWLLCITFGNVLVAFLAPLQSLSLATFFWTFSGLMGAAALIFTLLASLYKGKTYLQQV